LNLLSLLTGILLVVFYRSLIKRFFVAPGYERRFSFFEKHPIQPGDTVFLGDSITEWFPLDEMFPNVRIKNRGISGDTTDGILRRLHQITNGQPHRIFLKIGTNDVGFGHPLPQISANYETILARIKAESPRSAVFVLSILPRHPPYTGEIQRLNQIIAALAQKHNFTFIDLFPHFVNDQGGLRAEFTNDNLHLMGGGYAQFRDVIAPHVYTDYYEDINL
ncbi:MAG: hypothetical protein KC413_03975, partial [Anaerolineales bacterium]|nr:hypothetical protein [Anaerolineales bacterium]